MFSCYRILPVTFLFLSSIGACASTEYTSDEFILTEQTTLANGWLGYNGYEPALFPDADYENYPRFDLPENKKCISLVFEDKASEPNYDLTEYNLLDRKYVSVSGFVILYDSLQNGRTVHDEVLSKKYYKGALVENYCYRDYVFIVTNIQTLD